tara:strand:+ start:663 stop:917 length:255 start_codon:yes stop_codon:yes gene_type:complete
VVIEKATEINTQEEIKKKASLNVKNLSRESKIPGIEINAKGNMNAAADNLSAEIANENGLDSEIALAAYAATATGGVIADKTAK